MRLEADLSNFIHNSLSAVEISSDMQSSRNVELDAALSTASKNLTGGHGYPDHIALVNDFVLVMEDKADRLKLVLRDGEEILQTVDAVKNYALNGALFYALKIIDGSPYKKVFAFGNAGDRKHHVIQPIFIGADKKITELPEVDTFKNFTADNIEAYYRRMVLGEVPAEEVELTKILKHAATLHEYLRSYGQLGETEKPLIVSAILLALAERPYGFNVKQLTGDKIKTDGAKIFEYVENHLKRVKVRPEVKKEQVLDQFRLIKNRPLLNTVNRTLAKTPLKFFTEFVERNIFDAVVNNSAEDYLGRFYGKFISYSGGDGQSLGIVLTPRHITELFCDLVDLKPDDVVFDPCCGTGSFLITAMSRMLQDADDTQRKHIKTEQIHGIEAREDMFSIATTNMILRGDGQSNLLCGDFFEHDAGKLQLLGATVGFMNPPFSQDDKPETKHLSELHFIRHLLNSVTRGGRVAVIVKTSVMTRNNRADKTLKIDILRNHTLEGVISLNKKTFYRIGVVPCIAVFTAGEPHPKSKLVKFINFEDDGFKEIRDVGLVETERAKDRKNFLLDCWRGKIDDVPSKFMVTATIDAGDEWIHSFYYYNDELPTEDDFANTVADYLTFEFNMIAHGRGYLFDAKKNFPPLTETPTLGEKVWQIFDLASVFTIRATSSGIDKIRLTLRDGEFPYVTRSDRNNGIQTFICEQPNYGTDVGNCITVGLDTQTAFYQPKAFYTGQNIQILTHDRLNVHVANFLLPLIKNTLSIFSWGGNGATLTRLRRSKILLPVTDDGTPDFAFMESYVRSLEEKILRRYLERVSIPNVAQVPSLGEKVWREFCIGDLFRLETGKGKGANHLVPDERGISYLGATNRNNAVLNFVRPVENLIQRGNCIAFIRNGEGSVGYSVYKREDFIATSDITCGYADFLNEYVGWFITTVADQVRGKYNFNYKRSDTRLKREKILLPVTDDGKPDFVFMEAFAKNKFAEVLRRVLERFSG